jgi:hypothetical protein
LTENGNGKALSPEVAAIQTVDEFEEGHSRVKSMLVYYKKKATWEGKLLTEWKRDFDVKIPEGSGNVEIDQVLRTLSAKYHQAMTHKHNAESVLLMSQSRYSRLFHTKVEELTSNREVVIKGKKVNVSMNVTRAEHVAKNDPEIAETKKQIVVGEICVKMWEEILSSLRFTYGLAKNIQMGQMSENKLELANKFNTPANLKG